MTTVTLELATVPADTGEATLLTARRGDPGHEADFELWAKGILESAAAFPDHLGYGLFRTSGGDAPGSSSTGSGTQKPAGPGRSRPNGQPGSPTAKGTTTARPPGAP